MTSLSTSMTSWTLIKAILAGKYMVKYIYIYDDDNLYNDDLFVNMIVGSLMVMFSSCSKEIGISS